MAYTLTVTLFLAINYYGKQYEFFKQHISELGSIADSTFLSRLIMIVGLGICSALMLIVAIIYFVKNEELKGAVIKGILALILALGAAGLAIPLDHPNLSTLHLIGAACFVGGFAAYNAFAQISSSYRKIIKKEVETSPVDNFWDVFLSIIVILVLIGYFIIFALDKLGIGISLYIGPISQKITVFIEVLALYFIDNEDI